MDIFPIRTREDHAAALARIDALWGAEPGTPEGNLLDVLVDLVEHYEDTHHPISNVRATDLRHSRIGAKTSMGIALALAGDIPSPGRRILNLSKARSRHQNRAA